MRRARSRRAHGANEPARSPGRRVRRGLGARAGTALNEWARGARANARNGHVPYECPRVNRMIEPEAQVAVAEALARFPRERTWLLPALQSVQEIVGYLPDWALSDTGRHLRVPD